MKDSHLQLLIKHFTNEVLTMHFRNEGGANQFSTTQWRKKKILSGGADAAKGSTGREAAHLGGFWGHAPPEILKFESF